MFPEPGVGFRGFPMTENVGEPSATKDTDMRQAMQAKYIQSDAEWIYGRNAMFFRINAKLLSARNNHD